MKRKKVCRCRFLFYEKTNCHLSGEKNDLSPHLTATLLLIQLHMCCCHSHFKSSVNHFLIQKSSLCTCTYPSNIAIFLWPFGRGINRIPLGGGVQIEIHCTLSLFNSRFKPQRLAELRFGCDWPLFSNMDIHEPVFHGSVHL